MAILLLYDFFFTNILLLLHSILLLEYVAGIGPVQSPLTVYIFYLYGEGLVGVCGCLKIDKKDGEMKLRCHCFTAA